MSITNKIEYYKESLETFDDTLEKYRFLLDQGKKALPFPEEFRQDLSLIHISEPTRPY